MCSDVSSAFSEYSMGSINSEVSIDSTIAIEETRDQGGECGIGLTFSQRPTHLGFAVKRVKACGPAELEGTIQPQDVVLSIDGVSLSGKDMKEFARLMMGRSGSEAVLQVLKKGQDDPVSVTLVRHRS